MVRSHKRSLLNRIAEQLVYFTHLGLMLLFLFSGLIVTLRGVVIVYILVNVQLIIFGGCSITQLQQRYGWLGPREDFIPDVLYRFFRIKIPEKNYFHLYMIVYQLPLLVGLIANWN